MSIPTHGETYSKLLEHLRLAQEDAAMMGHLHNAQSTAKDRTLAIGWLKISDSIDRMTKLVTQMAMGRLQ